ncbi:MAG: hypothetical protein AABY84_00905 [Candidatus Firestonebacteria bacterium]
MKIKFFKNELLIAIVWSVFLSLITIIPYYIASTYTPKNMCFMGFFEGSFDQNSYLGWIKQGVEGNILFKNLYTVQEQSNNFFHPLFYLMGKFIKLINSNVTDGYHIFRIITGFLLLLLIYYFIRIFIEEKNRRLYSFILITISSGFGWLFSRELYEKLGKTFALMPIDLWITEGFTFFTVATRPIFIVSLALMLLIFYFFWISCKKNYWLYAFFAGIFSLLLTLIHPYDLVTVYTTLVIYIICDYINKKKLDINIIKNFLIVFLIALPALIYEYYIFNFAEVFKAWKDVNITISPNPYSYIIGYGLLIPFAIWGIFLTLKSAKTEKLLLLSWIFAVMVLTYLPFNFQRRFILGAQIPLCIFATEGIFAFSSYISSKKRIFNAKVILILLLLITLPSTFKFIFDNLNGVKKYYLNYNIYEDDFSAFEWINKNIKSPSNFISSFIIGMYLPGRTGNSVFVGHYHNTPNFSDKLDILNKFFNSKTADDFRTNVLKENSIDYLYYGQFEKNLGDFNPDNVKYLTVVYQISNVKIFKVIN